MMSLSPRREWCSRYRRHTCIKQQFDQEHQGLSKEKTSKNQVNRSRYISLIGVFTPPFSLPLRCVTTQSSIRLILCENSLAVFKPGCLPFTRKYWSVKGYVNAKEKCLIVSFVRDRLQFAHKTPTYRESLGRILQDVTEELQMVGTFYKDISVGNFGPTFQEDSFLVDQAKPDLPFTF